MANKKTTQTVRELLSGNADARIELRVQAGLFDAVNGAAEADNRERSDWIRLKLAEACVREAER